MWSLVGLQLGEIVLEAIDTRLPEGAEPLEIRVGLLQWLGPERTRAELRILAAYDQSRPFQHLEVLGDRRLGHVERRGELHHRMRSLPQAIENRPPGRIGQRTEDRAEAIGRCRFPSPCVYSHLAIYGTTLPGQAPDADTAADIADVATRRYILSMRPRGGAPLALGCILAIGSGCASVLRHGLPACSPPPLVDTAGWQRIQSASHLWFGAPPNFKPDSSWAYHSIHGGESWVDGGRHFVANYGYHGDVTQGTVEHDAVCQMDVGGRPAFVAWHARTSSTWVGAQWSNQPGSLTLTVGGASSDSHDLALFWTMLRTVQLDSGVAPR
jgi:hypothetical protein